MHTERSGRVATVEWAYEVSRACLASALPNRWAHVQSVADEAQRIGRIVDEHAELLVAAAVLHDVGYAPSIAVTGFHPLDGARYLAGLGASDQVAAWSLGTPVLIREAELRGLGADVARFRG